MSKLHLDIGEHTGELSGRGLRDVPCNRDWLPAELVTPDRGLVTCGNCKRWIAKHPLPAAELGPEMYVPGPPRPVERGASELDARDLDRLVREKRGEDDPAAGIFRSLDTALDRWFRARILSRVRGSTLAQGLGERESDSSDREVAPRLRSDRAVLEMQASVRHVEMALEVAAAAGVVFAGGEDGVGALTIPAAECRVLVIMYADGRSPGQIAEKVAEKLHVRDELVTERQIGIAWRTLRARMTEWMVERGVLVPPAKDRQEGATDMGAKLPGYDLEGVKAIADHLGLGIATVKRYMARRAGENPLPTRKYAGNVWASSSALTAWRSKESRTDAA